ncbi:hypothetical protein L6R29_15705 [Myxococcota bacterium]|nr:hypothetical protein [Myxococcota bacterium]
MRNPPTHLLFACFLLSSCAAFGFQACTLPPTAPPKERFFCATNQDCAQPAVCIRSLCYSLATADAVCSNDLDGEPICTPNHREPRFLSDASTASPDDNDVDAGLPIEKSTDSPRLSEESSQGRENNTEPPFDLHHEHALPDALPDGSDELERKHIERLPEPTPEPQTLPDSPRDPNTSCSQGQTLPCYPPETNGCSVHSRRCFGRCKLGQQTCTNGVWGACIGAITPQSERCDDQDWDCDGAAGNSGGRICN